MDPIEKAIRNALEKGNALDPAFRERVYTSAEHALSRSLSAHAGLDPAEKRKRISRLRHVVASIETEFAPAAPSPQVRPVASQQPSLEISAGERLGARPQAQASMAPDHRADISERRVGKSGKSSRLIGLLITVTFLALAVMLGWLLWTSSLFDKPAADPSGTTVENPGESSGASSAPKLGAAAEDEKEWVTVFAPSNAAAVDVSSGLSADLQGSGPDARLRLTASNGKGEATFEIGKGILAALRGKKAVFDVVAASAQDGSASQMSVSCDLAGLGNCQRTRFRVEGQPADNLILIDIADQEPEASGTLTIAPDMDGQGHPIDIISIRVREDTGQ